MSHVVAYHRPENLDEALRLLGRADAATVVLAGGTSVNADRSRDTVEAVDLQALGLEGITSLGPARVRIGAMARLQDVAEHPLVPALLRDLARRETPSTLRTIATVGGTVASGHGESQFLAGLLAFDGAVTLAETNGKTEAALDDLLAGLGRNRCCEVAAIQPLRSTGSRLGARIITAVTITTDGVATAERTARTPADTPIVAVVGRRAAHGAILMAYSGVGSTPVLSDDPSTLNPPGDFRGSSAYRRRLAVTLAERVRNTLETKPTGTTGGAA